VKVQDFYDLIQKIHHRPALYLGKKSLSHLQVFLDGYTFSRREMGIPLSAQEQDFEQFQDWIEQRFSQRHTQSWARIILFYAEDEADALDRFFELFDEFVLQHQTSQVAAISM
jgi:hypothetical protein